MFGESGTGLIKFTASIDDDVILFRVSGALTMDTIGRCDSAMSLVVSQGYRKLLIVLTGLHTIDQRGVLFLRGMSNLREEAGILVKMAARPQTEVYGTLRSYHVHDTVPLYTSVDEALYNFSREDMAELTRTIDETSGGLQFREGQVLEVTLDRGFWRSVHYCVLEQVYDQVMAITWPWGEGEDGLAMLGKGWRLQINFLTVTGIFSFSSTVSKLQAKPDPIVFISKPAEVYHLRRRNYPRLDVDIPISCRLFSDPFNLEDMGCEAWGLNLSGSGMLLIFSRQVLKDDSLLMKFSLGDEELNEIVGRIVRVDKLEEDGGVRWQTGVKYTAIFDSDRNKITRHVLDALFKEQQVTATQ